MRHPLTAMAANDIHEGGIVQSGPLSLQHTAIHNNYHIPNHRYPNTPGWHFTKNSNPLTWMWLSTFSTGERGSSRGINSDQSFASLKEFWLKQLKSILFYLYAMPLSLSFSFNWNSSYLIVFEMCAGSPNSRAADVRRADWTLNMWFSYLDSLIKWSNIYIAEGVNPILA